MVLPIGDLASVLHHLPGVAQLRCSAGGNISDIHTDWAIRMAYGPIAWWQDAYYY
jgi:hypothetical protein